MGRDTALAIAVAVVFAGFGAWYIFSGKTSNTVQEPSKPVAVNAPKVDKPRTEAPKPPTPVIEKPALPALQPPSATPPTAVSTGSPSPTSVTPGLQTSSTTRPASTTPPTPGVLSGATPASPAPATPAPGTPAVARHEVGTTPPPSSVATPGLTPAPQPTGVGTTPSSVGVVSPAGTAARHPLAKPDDKPAGTTPAVSVTSTPPTGEAKVHTVVMGDTFSSMATKYLGHHKHADLIAKANPDIDPRRLKLGAKVKIPAAPAQANAAASPAGNAVPAPAPSTVNAQPAVAKPAVNLKPGQQSYTVKAGDSLYSLARRFLGHDTDWVRIYELNKERIPDRERLSAGMVIILPEDAKVPPTSDSGKSTNKTLSDSSKPSKP